MKSVSRYLNGFIITTLLIGLSPLSASTQVHAANDDGGRPRLEVSRTLTTPVIDGKLDETIWKVDQPMTQQVGDAPKRESSFGMLWDNQYLYIGMKTEDDSMMTGASGAWLDQDNMNVFIDPTLHQSAPFTSDDMQIGLVYQPGTTTPEFHFGAALNNHAGKDEKKILRAINKTEKGWSSEVAVPWDMLHMDPMLSKQLGMEFSATDRYDSDQSKQTTNYWSAYQSSSFSNDTSGYGVIQLVDDNPVSGNVSPVLMDENFDSYAAGSIPFGWISDVNAGSNPFSIVKDQAGNGRLTFDGKAGGKQARITAPIEWDNYTIQADVRFHAVLDSARWAAIMFRGAANGKNPYNQMAIRQNGAYEVAYRKPDGTWYSPTPVTGTWKPLTLGADYTMKVRVFGNNVKEYLKAKNDADFTLVTDKNLSSDVLLERGKIGLQADQSTVSFDNLIVTRIAADRLELTLSDTLEALTEPVGFTGNVTYSDGVTEKITSDRFKLYSSDESVIKVINNQLYPIKPGKAKLTAVYANAVSSLDMTVTPSLTGIKVNSLQHDQGYVMAVGGVPIDLASVSFKADFSDLTSGTIEGDQLLWSTADSGISFADGKMTALHKGVYPVTAQKDGITVTMQVVAKNPTDTEYVLYEENFDSLADGSMPQGWTRKQGSTASKAAVKAGVFEMDARTTPDNPTRVLLPNYLELFGNYKIEADVTNLAANDTARWNSIMYRIQNNDYPYYQMAVRKDATAANGVELSEQTPDSTWNVWNTGSFSEAIDGGKMYHYTIKAYGNRVQASINNKVIIDSEAASAYTKGRIGLQANGSQMRVDNIRITLQQDALPPLPADRFVQVKEPETKIALAPTVVTELISAEQLASLAGPKLPATVFLYVNDKLTVTDPSGQTEIGSLDSVLAAIDTKMIPAFYVKDGQTVDRLVEYLQNVGLEDADIVSDNVALVKRARAAYPIVRGIVDFTANTDWSPEKLMDIRGQMNANLAKIILLPQNAASRDNVSYLQKRAMTVWTKEQAAPAEKNLAIHTLITAGANGIVTDSPLQAIDAMKLYSNQTTLVRKPYIVGHRGMPSVAPENTIVSNVLAIEAGADFIENDVYLSRDGHLVILHDGSLERTTNGTGFIENYTLEQIKQLNANKQFPLAFHNVQIPTLEEQIDLARQSGKMIMNEIKTGNPAVIEAFVKQVREKHAEDLINVIAFDSNQIKRLNGQLPEMPIGLLGNAGITDSSNVSRALRQTLLTVQNLNAGYNPPYSVLSQDYLEAAKHRGLLVSPWTFNNRSDFTRFFMYGTWGLTTDYANWASDWTESIKPGQEKYTLSENQSVDVSAEIQTYKGTLNTIAPEIVLLDGQDFVEVKGRTVTAKQTGTAHALLRYTTTIDAGNQYDIYTQPVSFTVEAAVIHVPVAGITLDKTEVTLTEGEQSSLTATAAPENATNKAVTWSSDNENVATVDANGLLTAVKAGTAIITVTSVDGGLTATAAVTVEAAVNHVPVAGVTLDKNEVTLTEGKQTPLTATVAPENATNKAVTWSSSNENVATVDTKGFVIAVKAGTANITVTSVDGGLTATTAVTVEAAVSKPGDVTNVKVVPGDQQLALTWEDPADLTQVKLVVSGGTGTAVYTVDQGLESYVVTNLANGTEYNIHISTIDAYGIESEGFSVKGTPKAASSVGSSSSGNISDGAVVNENGEVSIKPTLHANGKASAKLGAGTMKKALEQAKGGKLQIKVEAAASMNELEVELPVVDLLSSGNGSINNIELDTGLATVTVSTKLISKGSEAAKKVTISVAKADISSVPAETQDQLKDAVVYDLSLSVDGKKISEFDGRSDVQVAVPYELQPGEHPNKVVIYYISDNGELKVVTNGMYNAATGKVEFKPKHFGKYAAAYVEASFEDVTKAWAKDPIEALAARGIVSGMGNGQFNPDGKVTRAEFITMLMNVFGLTDANAATTLSDVKAGAWYYDEVATAYELGIVSGRPNGSFGVHEEITRQDMAVMVHQAATHVQLQLSVSASEAFTDRQTISDYAQKAVAAMQAEGIINGMGNGEFAPKQQATRAQAAVIIYAILERM
ncbi:S-layer homology domain-containing protein [Paenibacillus sp. 2TAB23]|uniref:S-layer homology domain-containing protein n=1 Tax=Paenibacillus sp. 2TAB23 TaxID=3233004 RepID=UPI003F963F77